MPNLRKGHIDYLKERGVTSELHHGNYFSDSDHLGIQYLKTDSKHYKDSKGDDYVVRRLFPTGKPKLKAPTGRFLAWLLFVNQFKN